MADQPCLPASTSIVVPWSQNLKFSGVLGMVSQIRPQMYAATKIADLTRFWTKLTDLTKFNKETLVVLPNMADTEWITIVPITFWYISLDNLHDLVVWQKVAKILSVICTMAGWRKSAKSSISTVFTLTNLTNIRQNRQMNIHSVWRNFVKSCSRGGGGVLKNVLYGEAPPQGPNPLPFYIPFFQKRHRFRIPFIGKRYPFHIPSEDGINR